MFLPASIFFLITTVAYALLSAAVIYHLRAYGLAESALGRQDIFMKNEKFSHFFIPLFFISSFALWFSCLFFLLRLPA